MRNSSLLGTSGLVEGETIEIDRFDKCLLSFTHILKYDVPKSTGISHFLGWKHSISITNFPSNQNT